jgi:DNA adenine methylase
LAAAIVEELGPHRVYWDPCCGSMAVPLAKPPCVMETVNDLNGDLINMARVIQSATLGPKLYCRLRRTLMAEQLFTEAAKRHRARGELGDVPPDLDAAYDYFLCSWMGRNGVAGTASYNQGFCMRYTANGGHSAKRWSGVVASIPAWRRRMLNLTICCRDMFEILPRIDDQKGTAIYVDPPYLVKGAKYVHDFTPGDHQRLATELARFRKARVVVSYYEHPNLDRLYPGWTRRRIEVTKAMANQNRGLRDKEDGRAVEVLLLNGPSYGDPEKPAERSLFS